jgi:hypothetical protein
MIMIALIFWQNLGFFWQAKSEKFPKKIKFSPNMIMTNQKGPVNSIKKQKYIQNSWKYITTTCTRTDLVTWECHLHG